MRGCFSLVYTDINTQSRNLTLPPIMEHRVDGRLGCCSYSVDFSHRSMELSVWPVIFSYDV